MPTSPPEQAPEWTIRRILQWTTSYFDAHAVDSPRVCAEILLAHVLGLRRIDLYLRYDQPLNREELGDFKILVKRRIDREPVAYIVGIKEFWSMDMHVTRDVLIPRPETECLVEAARDRLATFPTFCGKRVLELGTGSGAAVIALASQISGPGYYASDRSLRAIAVAVGNARRHGLAAAIQFVCGDWFAPFDRRRPCFDLLFSNPPYIPREAIRTLQPEIRRYEPVEALDGGLDGLAAVRRIVREAPPYLKPGGSLLLEIGHDQREAVMDIAKGTGHYTDVTVADDYAGRPRVASMRLP